MDNLNKLLTYLINPNEVAKIANSAGVSSETVQNVCVEIFGKLIPTDFTRQDGAHIEKKDLNAITSNFNNLLNSANLKGLIKTISEKYSLDQAKSGLLVKEILVIVRDKLQYMTAVKKENKPKEEKPVMTRSALKKEIREDAKEETSEPFKEETPKKVVKKVSKQEVVEDDDEEDLSKGEKIALYIVGGLLVAVIIVVIVILVKVLKG